MEKLSLGEQHNSFSKTSQIPSSPTTLHSSSLTDASYRKYSRKYSRGEDLESPDRADPRRLFGDIDKFTNILLEIDDKSSGPPETPDFVETFSKMIESKLEGYNRDDARRKLGEEEMSEDDMFFIDAVAQISKLTNALSQFPSYATLNRTSMVLQRAMTFLEEEFRALLEDTKNSLDQYQSSCNVVSNQDEHSDRCMLLREPDSVDSPAYSPEVVTKMNKIATTMVFTGYETECCQVYIICRRNAIRQQMERLEFEKINIDNVVKMPWESLEGEISRWIRVVKFYSQVIFPSEKKLGELVFSEHPRICQSHFSNLAREVVIQLLDFAEAVAMSKRSAEKLFKFLDMYETLKNLNLSMDLDLCSADLMAEIASGGDRVGEAAASIFCDLENSIKNDGARTPVPGGAVHPLTRYVMNYLKYASEYKDTLEKIFEKHSGNDNINHYNTQNEASSSSPSSSSELTPFSIQVVRVMELLDANLEAKSNLYRDPSLRYIFLMNNGRYILQKVKGSAEIRLVMGDTWCRRRSTVVRQYHKSYQRETWSRVLQCLNQEGLQVNGGKVNKAAMKERLKTFNTTFEEIHRTQSSWMVSDEQLQSELRVSLSAVVIPAYRSFVGRFRQHLDNGKQADKYIKYQPEDIETLIEDLFEGSTTSMSSRRRL